MDNRDKRDIHIIKYYSAVVTVSNGRVIKVTEPTLMFCPLAKHLYKEFKNIQNNDKETIKQAIKSAIESKIRDYGLFTAQRRLNFIGVSIPYGASEMLRYALKKKAIDAAVVVCDGAGTVITSRPALVQGIGARMNSLLLTTPIPGVIKKLKTTGGQVIFKDAHIDQYQGVKKAIAAGYKTIAVTISAYASEDLKRLRLLEKKHNVKIISLVLCTTGITKDKIAMIRDYADLVWSCASLDIRRLIGPVAMMQLSQLIPVFVLTSQGVNLVSAYATEKKLINKLDFTKQYLVSHEYGGQCVHLGGFRAYIRESLLPVSNDKAPSLTTQG
jgi:putative methanogenesis marker protein 8